jgi:hypothetical protein
LEGNGRAQIEVLSWNLSAETEKPQNTSVTITDVPEEIRIKYVPNTDLDLYLYINLLSVKSKKKVM